MTPDFSLSPVALSMSTLSLLSAVDRIERKAGLLIRV